MAAAAETLKTAKGGGTTPATKRRAKPEGANGQRTNLPGGGRRQITEKRSKGIVKACVVSAYANIQA
jgi:hypothetical protein